MIFSEVADLTQVSTAPARCIRGERQSFGGLLLEFFRAYHSTVGSLAGEKSGASLHLVRAVLHEWWRAQPAASLLATLLRCTHRTGLRAPTPMATTVVIVSAPAMIGQR